MDVTLDVRYIRKEKGNERSNLCCTVNICIFICEWDADGGSRHGKRKKDPQKEEKGSQ